MVQQQVAGGQRTLLIFSQSAIGFGDIGHLK
jgi:hypothetical protein